MGLIRLIKRIDVNGFFLAVIAGSLVSIVFKNYNDKSARFTGFENGIVYGDGIARHCIRETLFKYMDDQAHEYNGGTDTDVTRAKDWIDGEFVKCEESLAGTGDAETKAVRETYPNYKLLDY